MTSVMISDSVAKYVFSSPESIDFEYQEIISIAEEDFKKIFNDSLENADKAIEMNQIPSWNEVPATGGIWDAILALSLIKKLWDSWMKAKLDLPEDIDSVEAFFIINGEIDESINYPKVTLEGPSLVFLPGSIHPLLIKTAFKVPRWAIGLTVRMKHGIAPSSWATDYASELRTSRRHYEANLPLPKLEEIKPKHLEGKDNIIILLHGLFSTDIGTFNPLLEYICPKPEQYKNPVTLNKLKNTLIVGWPHDTLSSIDNNASSLRRLIIDKLGKSNISIAFIAHSRGGLLARRVTTLLLKGSHDSNNKWYSYIKGLVSFGTPHEGATLAEAPKELMGVVAVVQSLNEVQPVWPMLLAYFNHKNNIEGILDMQTNETGSCFQKQLMDEEQDTCIKENETRQLNIFAIGGIAPESPIRERMTKLINATEGRHDLVVSLESTLPFYANKKRTTECNHFEYFDNNDTNKLTVEYLRDVLNLSNDRKEKSYLKTWVWDYYDGGGFKQYKA